MLEDVFECVCALGELAQRVQDMSGKSVDEVMAMSIEEIMNFLAERIS